jgi:HEAT repeat protein
VRAAAGEVLSELKESASAAPLIPFLSGHTAEVRMLALRAVRALRVDAAFAPAMEALKDSDAAVRREAVGVLGYLRKAEAVGALAEIAARDPDPEVRRIAIGAIGYSSEVSVLPSLTRALTDVAWMVRDEAAQTLGKLRLALAVPDLIRAMQDDYWQVRVKAARSLGLLKAAAAPAGAGRSAGPPDRQPAQGSGHRAWRTGRSARHPGAGKGARRRRPGRAQAVPPRADRHFAGPEIGRTP